MGHDYQWSRWSGTPLRRSKILANEISRCLQETRSIQRPRLVRWKFIKEFPAHPETSHGRRLLRRDSAVGRAIQEDHAAGLTITGQYDGDELGALTFYRDHMANISPETRVKHFLIIGPWDHAGTRTPTDGVGGVKFGSAAIVVLNDLHRQWCAWTKRNGPDH